MDRLEDNLRAELRSWSQYDYEILTSVLTTVQVILPKENLLSPSFTRPPKRGSS